MSFAALIGGIMIYSLRKWAFRWYEGLPSVDSLEVFERVMGGLTLAARHVTCLLENGSLQRYIALMLRSEEHTSELQSLMRTSYAVFCLEKNKMNEKQKHQKQ